MQELPGLITQAALFVFFLVCAGINSDAMANGGSVDFSNTVGTGNVIYSQYRGIELISENLPVTPGLKYVDVVASYTLLDTGDGLQTEYAFPVDLTFSEFIGTGYGISSIHLVSHRLFEGHSW